MNNKLILTSRTSLFTPSDLPEGFQEDFEEVYGHNFSSYTLDVTMGLRVAGDKNYRFVF